MYPDADRGIDISCASAMAPSPPSAYKSQMDIRKETKKNITLVTMVVVKR